MVKVLVLRSAGINCNDETQRAFELAGAEADQVHVSEIINGYTSLSDYQILVIPGGFSYGDDAGAGKILASELSLRLKDPLDEFIRAGKLILGICNGFQVLVRTGLLPWKGEQAVSLAQNTSGKFECRWVNLIADEDCIFTKGIKSMYLPVAHGEGRIIFRAENADAIKKHIVLKYADQDGNETDSYPSNPNGSMQNIAGLSSQSGLIMGLMPHPERYVEKEQHPSWTRRDGFGEGLKIFQNAVRYVEVNL